MPRVVADREGVAGIARELHLRRLRQRAVRGPGVEDGADMRVGIVGRQVELHGDALPLRVGVRRDAVARNVAGEHRDRIHDDLAEVVAEAPLEAGRESPHERRLHLARGERASDQVPGGALGLRQVAGEFGKQVDLHPCRRAVLANVALVAPGQRPVVGRVRHVGDHRGVDVVGKHAVKLEMKERRLDRAARPDVGDDGGDQVADVGAVTHVPPTLGRLGRVWLGFRPSVNGREFQVLQPFLCKCAA